MAVVLGAWARYFFGGFAVCRLPFGLPQRFRGMLQSGIEVRARFCNGAERGEGLLRIDLSFHPWDSRWCTSLPDGTWTCPMSVHCLGTSSTFLAISAYSQW